MEPTMEQPHTFDSIWYRAKPATESSKADPFVRERGRLVVEGDALRFEGRTANLVLRNVEAVEYGVYGTMTNPSVQVRYREGDQVRHAWFTDGRLGGYSGVFGGTRQLAQAMSHVGPTTFDNEAPRASQRRLAWILVGLVLVFIARALRAG
jgi:hypothetical protein